MGILSGFHGYFSGETSAYRPTSAYATFGYAPAVSTLSFDIIRPSTGKRIDVIFKRNVLSSLTSGFTLTTTSYLNVSSSTPGTDITKRCFQFAIQARQSTNSTKFGSAADSVKVRWLMT